MHTSPRGRGGYLGTRVPALNGGLVLEVPSRVRRMPERSCNIEVLLAKVRLHVKYPLLKETLVFDGGTKTTFTEQTKLRYG